jgi:hypothetical protein
MDQNGRKLNCNGNDKRYIRRPFHSPSYPNPQYKGQEKGNVKDRKKPRKPEEMEKLASMLTETVPAIKSLLEGVAADHRRLAEAEERRVAVEERKAQASEAIAAALKQLIDAASAGQVPMAAVAPRAEDVPPEKPDKMEKDRALRIITDMRGEGSTYRQIAARLDSENISTFSGKGKWHAQTIHRICQAENL